MNCFDLHCDTATELFDKAETLDSASGQISSGSIKGFENYGQVFAVFTKVGISDDSGYERFFKVTDEFAKDNAIDFITDRREFKNSSKTKYILSAEDARILNADISRLDALFDRGMRILTLLWSGVTCIGGSFDTDQGLSDFGKKVTRRCFELGIIPDVSHASELSCRDMLDIAEEYGMPLIASHSNSKSVFPHPRNITDTDAKRIVSLGGIIGACMCSLHIGDGDVTSEDLLRHIEYLESITDSDHICLGCDFDGTNDLPLDIKCQRDIHILAEAMARHGYSDERINNIFYNNAYSFLSENIGRKRKVTK